MNDLIIHYSIEDAEPADFSPIYGDDDDSTEIPCFDFFFESGIDRQGEPHRQGEK